MDAIFFRLHGIDHATTLKVENGVDQDETISNNILLDTVNTKRTNANVSSYAISLYERNLIHFYCGEDHIFMKSQDIDHKIYLKGVQQIQSNIIVT